MYNIDDRSLNVSGFACYSFYFLMSDKIFFFLLLRLGNYFHIAHTHLYCSKLSED